MVNADTADGWSLIGDGRQLMMACCPDAVRNKIFIYTDTLGNSISAGLRGKNCV
jgi:hypothetical protein